MTSIDREYSSKWFCRFSQDPASDHHSMLWRTGSGAPDLADNFAPTTERRYRLTCVHDGRSAAMDGVTPIRSSLPLDSYTMKAACDERYQGRKTASSKLPPALRPVWSGPVCWISIGWEFLARLVEAVHSSLLQNNLWRHYTTTYRT